MSKIENPIFPNNNVISSPNKIIASQEWKHKNNEFYDNIVSLSKSFGVSIDLERWKWFKNVNRKYKD